VIITKTPFRISFFGGATDYPEHFMKNGGAVLGTAIDKFAYISVIPFYSRLFDYSVRLAYRRIEHVKNLDEIKHAPIRACLEWCGIMKDIEINYTGELPAFSGLGTSSSFVVGLLNALYAYQGRSISPIELAYQAIKIERDVLKEAVGCQDQAFAALGGFNILEFRTTEDIIVNRVPLSPKRIEEFEEHLLLVYTGIKRRASTIAAKQIKKIDDNRERLKRMREMVDEGYEILTGSGSLTKFGLLLDQAWRVKSELDTSIAGKRVRAIYEEGRKAGALGGKLLGAGGGGFFLFFVPPEKHQKVAKRLNLEEIPIKVNAPGSHIINA
jgi:D-glycero-alpha-D-manno-heptose-7-phosphate kinase